MNLNSINYFQTIKKNKLEYKGKQVEVAFSIFISCFLSLMGLLILKISFTDILNSDPRKVDYFLAFFLPVIIIALTIFMVKKILNRHNLRELNYVSRLEDAKKLINKTAEKINWKILEENGQIFIFQTDLGPLMDRQKVVIIIHESGRILFNCTEFFGNHFRKTRFEDNFIKFQANFRKLEEAKTAANKI